MATENIAFRGKNEDSQSGNRGNFRELLALIANIDPALASFITENKHHESYTSPEIQNEILDCLGTAVRTSIINDRKFFSTVVDETSDSSKLGQLCLIIRYALDGEIHENSLQFQDVSSTTGETLFATVIKLLENVDLDVKNIRGQGTDGARNMTGSRQEFTTRLEELVPLAIPVHCSCHALNFILVKACSMNTPIKVFFSLVEEMHCFIEASPKRHAIFKDIQAQMGLKPVSLKRNCQTCWESHHQVLKALVETLPAVYETLNTFVESQTSSEIVSKANELLKVASNFEFVLNFVTMEDILSKTFIAAKALQTEMKILSKNSFVRASCWPENAI